MDSSPQFNNVLCSFNWCVKWSLVHLCSGQESFPHKQEDNVATSLTSQSGIQSGDLSYLMAWYPPAGLACQ